MGRADNENLGIAFALVIGAGAATGLGAAVVFVPALVKLASRKTLAGALGLSAGVMTYVSFVEIFAKSQIAFEDSGHDADKAYIYATLCFFFGVILMVVCTVEPHSFNTFHGDCGVYCWCVIRDPYLAFVLRQALNQTVTWLLGGHHHHHHLPDRQETGRLSSSNIEAAEEQTGRPIPESELEASNEPTPAAAGTETQENNEISVPVCACCAEDPVGDLRQVQDMAAQIETFEATENQNWEGHEHSHTGGSVDGAENPSIAPDPDAPPPENKKLMRMSLNTALAIGVHNFPEGLATFVAALNDPSVGAVLAIAIAIHNVPEGLCVAMPVYYATGSKLQAFGWAMMSGAAEPIAALLGWAVLANSFSDDMYGALFGIVAGMMVIISSRELLPTAHRYDPEDSVVTYSFMAGMAIMAVSLVLFLL
jgi:ZIP family zinc transporter